MNIPKGHALMIANGRVMIVPLAEIEWLKSSDTSVPDEPIASMSVSAENLDEAVARVLALLTENNDEDREE
jgi:hypothetical protein